MSNKLDYIDHLSDAQVVELLSLALPSANARPCMLAEFDRLTGLAPDELLQMVMDELTDREIGTEQAAGLLGVTELTVKRWFQAAAAVSESVRPRLAGLYLLLSLAREEADDSEPANLVREAISLLGRKPVQEEQELGSQPHGVLGSVFGAAGLMAAALHVALAAEWTDDVFRQEE